MKYLIAMMVSLHILPASVGHADARSYEKEHLIMAEASIVTTLMADAYSKSKYRCTQHDYTCLGAHQSELGLALISARNTKLSRESLAKLLRFNLDGALSEDYTCQVLEKGQLIITELNGLNSKRLKIDCLKEIEATIRKTGKKFDGFDSTKICAPNEAILEKRVELLKLLKQNKTCD